MGGQFPKMVQNMLIFTKTCEHKSDMTKITDQNLSSELTRRTYKLPIDLIHSLEDVHHEITKAYRSEGTAPHLQEFVAAALAHAIDQWHTDGTESPTFNELQRIISLRD